MNKGRKTETMKPSQTLTERGRGRIAHRKKVWREKLWRFVSVF